MTVALCNYYIITISKRQMAVIIKTKLLGAYNSPLSVWSQLTIMESFPPMRSY